MPAPPPPASRDTGSDSRRPVARDTRAHTQARGLVTQAFPTRVCTARASGSRPLSLAGRLRPEEVRAWVRDGLQQLKAVFGGAGCSGPGPQPLPSLPWGDREWLPCLQGLRGDTRGLLQKGAWQDEGHLWEGGGHAGEARGREGVGFSGRCSFCGAPAPGASRRSRDGRRE